MLCPQVFQPPCSALFVWEAVPKDINNSQREEESEEDESGNFANSDGLVSRIKDTLCKMPQCLIRRTFSEANVFQTIRQKMTAMKIKGK